MGEFYSFPGFNIWMVYVRKGNFVMCKLKVNVQYFFGNRGYRFLFDRFKVMPVT